MSDLEARAQQFAAQAHGAINQRRKFTGELYIVHPAAVVKLVRSVPHDEAMLAAAWLHDVVEDTPVTLTEVVVAFGSEVAGLVGWLTKTATKADGDRAARQALNIAHSAAAPARAQTIKMADVVDNIRTVAKLSPEFARAYLPEKAALVGALRHADPALTALARQHLGAYI